MEPGIYKNIAAKDYHALSFVSNSYLRKLGKCPANAKIEDVESTQAMIIGSAAHTFILEGNDAFHSEFVVLPEEAPKRPTERQIYAKKPSPETLYAVEWWNRFNSISNGKMVISNDDYQMISGMRDSVRSHPFAKLLLAEGVSETTVIFDKQIAGQTMRCKCRPDRTPAVEMGTLIDLKTTEDAGYDSFLRSCIKFGYITQAAFYIDGYNAVRGDAPEMDSFAFIAVEKKAPYRCEVYTVDMDFLKWGRGEYERLMLIEAECRAAVAPDGSKGFYPNYQNAGAEDLIKPAWLV